MSRSDDERVVVTGLGMVTPHGVGVAAAWSGVIEGRSAVGPVRRFDASAFPVTFGAETPDPGDASGWLAGRAVPDELLPLA